MKTYLVDLIVSAGGIETRSLKLMAAQSEDAAAEGALLTEARCRIDEGAEWSDDGLFDLDGQVHYCVRGCQEIAPEDVPGLRRYLGTPLRLAPQDLEPSPSP